MLLTWIKIFLQSQWIILSCTQPFQFLTTSFCTYFQFLEKKSGRDTPQIPTQSGLIIEIYALF